MRACFLLDGREHEAWLSREPGGGYLFHAEGREQGVCAALDGSGGGADTLLFDRSAHSITVATEGDDVHIHLDGRTYILRYLDPVRRHATDSAGAAGSEARAPMPGTTIAVLVAEGQAVAAGEGLVVIESMKLETVIRATRAGIVKAVLAREGQSFGRDQVLVALEEEG